MDMDCMDVETIQETWILARRAWDLARRQQRRRQAAGEPLTDAEDSSLRRARADFQAAERLWDDAYRAGIVIAVDERDGAGLTGLYQQVVSAPPDNAPRLAYAGAVQGADPERADFIQMQIEERRLRREYRDDPRRRELSVRAHQLSLDRTTE